jgi:hypothetical protein
MRLPFVLLFAVAVLGASCGDDAEEGATDEVEVPARTVTDVDPETFIVTFEGGSLASMRLHTDPIAGLPLCSVLCTDVNGSTDEQNLLESPFPLGLPIDRCNTQCTIEPGQPLGPGAYVLVYRWGIGGNETRGGEFRFDVQ